MFLLLLKIAGCLRSPTQLIPLKFNKSPWISVYNHSWLIQYLLLSLASQENIRIASTKISLFVKQNCIRPTELCRD